MAERKIFADHKPSNREGQGKAGYVTVSKNKAYDKCNIPAKELAAVTPRPDIQRDKN